MYSLKYYWEKNLNGRRIRLEIFKKDNSAAPMEIGDVVQGLSLNIDGGEDNLDKPIVSTSLVMTFVDSYDHPDAEQKKTGNWAEFYTPDATMWKVILSCNGSPVWGGYVTPDSYEEDLVYGGSVTIVARDNIGHLNDFPFDGAANDYGMISFRDLIEDAWAKIESPMTLLWADEWLMCGEVSATDTYINASALEGKNWYESVESLLYSYGAALRYKGGNEYIVCPLASLPDIGEDSGIALKPVFVTGATRMLTPAVKRIEESVQYDLSSAFLPLVEEDDFTGAYHTLKTPDKLEDLPWKAFEIANTELGKGWANTDPAQGFFFTPKDYAFRDTITNTERERIKGEMYLLCNTSQDETHIEHSISIEARDITLHLGFGRLLARFGSQGNYYVGISSQKVTYVCYSVKVTQNGVDTYCKADGTPFSSTRWDLTLQDDNGIEGISIPVNLSEYTGEVMVTIIVRRVAAVANAVQVSSLEMVAGEGISLLSVNNVNTNFSEQNNVVITRDPVFAPAMDRVALPSIIKNGIFLKNGNIYLPAEEWSWQGGTGQQMAVYTHLQILPYYAKPNNILEGNIVNADVAQFGNRWVWEGKNHLLVAGRFNMLTGYIEGAILREYLRYDDLWADVPEMERPSVQTSSRTNAETTGTGASSQPTSYANTTNVTIGLGGTGEGGAAYLNDLLDVNAENVVAGSVLYFNGSQWEDRSLPVWLEELLEKSAFLASLWQVDPLTGEMFTTRKVHIKEDLYADGDVSAGGEGEEGEGDTYLTEIFTRLGIAEADIAEIQSVLDNIGEIGAFLPLTGGTISSDYEQTPLKIATTAYEWVALRMKTKTSAVGGSLVYAGGSIWEVTDDGWNQSYALLHEGNFTNYALSKSGTAADSDKLKGKGAWEYFQRYGTIGSQSDMDVLDKARCGVYQTNHYSPVEGAYDYGQLLNFHDIAGVAQIYFADYNRGVFVRYNWNGYSQDVGSWKRLAYTTDNVASADIAKTAERLTKTLSNESINLWQNDGVQMISVTDEGYEALGAPKRWISGLSVLTSYVGWQLVCGASRWNSTDFFIRKRSDENTFTEWKTLAFLDSNVASATKLQTPRAIWGQSFDGSADISGALTGVSYIAMNGHIGGLSYINDNATNGFMFGSRSAVGSEGGALIYAYGNTPVSIYTGGGERMHIASSGNVGIGRVPSYKLDVNGQIRAVIEDKFGIIIEKASGGYDGGGISFWYGDWHRGSIDASILTLNPYTKGKVGVGISNPEALLDVNGDARVRGCLSFSGITTLNTPVIKFANGEYLDMYGNFVFLKNSGSWSIFDQNKDNSLFCIYRASGNVGIGNADPLHRLHINGNMQTDGSHYLNGSIIRKEYYALDTDENGNLKFKRTPAQVALDWSVQLPSGEKLFKLSNDGICELKCIKIGDAFLTWDSANNAIKIDSDVYATGEVAAGGTAN